MRVGAEVDDRRPYKERLGCTANLEADVFLYGPRLRQRGINLVSSAFVVAARPLRRLHER